MFLNKKHGNSKISDFIKCSTLMYISFLIIYVQDNFNTNAFVPDIDDIILRCEIHRGEAFNTDATTLQHNIYNIYIVLSHNNKFSCDNYVKNIQKSNE